MNDLIDLSMPDPSSGNINYKLLKKAATDALPLIKEQLAPFKGYGQKVELMIEGQSSGKYVVICTRRMFDPQDTRPFEPSLRLKEEDGYAYIQDCYDKTWCSYGLANRLSPVDICYSFCLQHGPEIRRVFTELCEYHEMQRYQATQH